MYCIYWPLLGTYYYWDIIKFSDKDNFVEDFDEFHRLFFDGTSEKLPLLRIGLNIMPSLQHIQQQWLNMLSSLFMEK